MAVDLTSLVDAYVERLGIQYRDKPNARALVALFVQAALADGVPLQLSDAFDLTNAVGPQLDILGKYIGSTRSVITTIDTDYFGFVLDAGGGNTNGFQDDNPIPQLSSWQANVTGADNLYAVAYGNGTFVAVGQSSPYVVTSPDGITWTPHNPGLGFKLQCVAFGNGVFIAAGTQGTYPTYTLCILKSTDNGVTWSLVGTQAQFITATKALCYGNGEFVLLACGDAGYDNFIQMNSFVSSDDGASWSHSDTTFLIGSVNYPIAYTGSKFVATLTNQALVSTNGTSWASHSMPNLSWADVTYGNGILVAVSSVSSTTTYTVTSTDNGTTWSAVSKTVSYSGWCGIAYGLNVFVIVGQNASYHGVMSSPDGVNWTVGTAPTNSVAFNSVCFGPNRFVVVANDGSKAGMINILA